MAKAFYEILGVQDGATHEEIKRAYRLKAKALHPDVNKTRDTTREFQELQEAYSVLGSPERRKLYDEGNEEAARSPETKATEADFDPFPCTSCEQISAQPRFISFYWVTSFIIFTYRRECSGIYCPSCAAKRLFWSSLITGAIGWIGFPWGPAYFINALVYNIIGGKKDAEANALVLTKQALYFHNSGMPDVAAAIAAEALPYAQKSSKTSSGAACLNALGFFAGRKVVMNSKWKGLSKPRLAALIGFAIPICTWYFLITINQEKSLIHELDRSATTINRQCPRMIDQITRIDSAMSGPGSQLTYNYTVTTITSSEVDVGKLHEDLYATLVSSIRNDTSMMRLANKGVIFHYNYFGKDGAILTKITLDNENFSQKPIRLSTKANSSVNAQGTAQTINIVQSEEMAKVPKNDVQMKHKVYNPGNSFPGKEELTASAVQIEQVEQYNKTLRNEAERGDAKAQFRLGNTYFTGEGVLKDEVEAINWWRKAAEQGYAEAQFWLGGAYDKGVGVLMDKVEALKWYRQSADQGYAFAQLMIGASYASGEGVLKDEVEAVKWYRKAAEQGYAMAQCDLADCYYDGKGIAKDDTEAVKWYRKAAEQGYASAQNNLGYHYANGKGVQYDAASAYMWYLLAAAQGLEVAKETVSKIAPHLTPAQRSEGERKAREFKPRHNSQTN
jgi:TPR repeat protein